MNVCTTYMGLELRNPLLASASPLSNDADRLRQLEDAGVGAIVLFSLFEEQVQRDAEQLARRITDDMDRPDPEHSVQAGSAPDFVCDPEHYLRLITWASTALDIPVIGSLNGCSEEGWIEYARMMEQAGAQGLELNIQITPTDLSMSGADVEARYLYIVESVTASVRIPVALKCAPYFSSLPHMAAQLEQSGLDALVFFNRFMQADLDIESWQPVYDVPLSTSYDTRLPMMWIQLLHGQLNISLAASGGVRSAEDVVKYILCGADAVMTTSALLDYGVDHVQTMLRALAEWMNRKEISCLAEMRGHLRLAESPVWSGMPRQQYVQLMNANSSARWPATEERSNISAIDL